MNGSPNRGSRDSTIVQRFARMVLREMLAKNAFEEPVSFQSDGFELAGRLYLPPVAQRPAPGALLVHGLTGSRDTDTRLLVWTARALAHSGIAALTFDLRGHGESEGDFVDTTIDDELADTRVALDRLAGDERVDPCRLGMLGHSLGGVLAARLGGSDARLRSIALWAAPATFSQWADRYVEGAENRTESGWDLRGVEMGAAFVEEARDLDVLTEFGGSACPVLLVHGTEDPTVAVEHMQTYRDAAQAQGRLVEALAVEGADHCFNSLQWRLELIDATRHWFLRTLSGGD
jgi:hypothetical protein